MLVNVRSLTLNSVSVSFIAFLRANLEACFGSLGKTVRELRLEVCALDWKLLAFLKLFSRLEALEINDSMWVNFKFVPPTGVLESDTVLRGSFTTSGFKGFTDENIRKLDSLSAARLKYHTITLGYSSPSIFSHFNTFARCKDHLEKLVLTEACAFSSDESECIYLWFLLHLKKIVLTGPVIGGSAYNLSPCGKLVEIYAQFNSADFAYSHCEPPNRLVSQIQEDNALSHLSRTQY